MESGVETICLGYTSEHDEVMSGDHVCVENSTVCSSRTAETGLNLSPPCDDDIFSAEKQQKDSCLLQNNKLGLGYKMSSVCDDTSTIGCSSPGHSLSDVGDEMPGAELNISDEMDRMIEELPLSVSNNGTEVLNGSQRGTNFGPVSGNRESSCAMQREKSGNDSSGLKQQSKFAAEECDNNSQQNHSSLQQVSQPPSGPFVVGDQMDVMAEIHPKTRSDIFSTSFSGSLVEGNCLSSPLGYEPGPFFNQTLPNTWKQHITGVLGHQDRHPRKNHLDFTFPRHQKVRTDLSLASKVHLINISETTGRSQRSLAAEFHISVGSVNNILKRKREYKEAFDSKATAFKTNGLVPRCYHSPEASACNKVQMLMMRWIESAKVKIKPLTWPTVLEKAREFAAKLKITNLNRPVAWLETLWQSMDISLQQMASDIKSESDATLLAKWCKMLPYLVQGYQPENIFCVTETTLYYKCLPDCCFIGGPLCQNASIHTEMLEHRLTVLLCCNALGERLKPLVISRHPCPASLRGVPFEDMPVIWYCQPTAVITTNIFAEWLRSLEASMEQQKRHIALFMEMTPSHLSSVLLKHVNLKFFLDDSAHILQPLNLGIIRDLKAYFRRRLLQTALAHCSADDMAVDGAQQAVKTVTELDAVFWIQEAWRTISLDSIRSCFKKAAFPQTSASEKVPACVGESGSEPLPSDFLHLVQEAGRVFHFTPMAPDLYVDFDSPVPCHSIDLEEWEKTLQTETTKIKLIKKEPGEDENVLACSSQMSAVEGYEDISRSVTPSEALDSLATLKHYSSNNIGLLTTVYELESVILDLTDSSMHS